MSTTDGQILTKFGTVMSLSPQDPLSKQNLTWWPITIWKIKKIIISKKKFAPISANFSVLMNNGPS